MGNIVPPSSKILPGKIGAKARKINRKIHAKNAKDFEEEQMKMKILLLGPGESGKSTLFRQLQLLYGTSNDELDCRNQVCAVHKHTISGMKALLRHSDNKKIHDQEAVNLLSNLSERASVDKVVGHAIQGLWKDPCIQETWNRRHTLQVFDTSAYFFDQIERIVDPHYVPSIEDILHVRYRTNGVETETYEIDGSIFEVYDVGGQRNERRKWVHCFNNVSAIIFVAAISEFDQVCFEDATQNRVQEALDLFAEVCGNPVLQQPCLILFMNKIDAFRAKIQEKNINSVPLFSDYEGELGDFESGVQYFYRLFLQQNHRGRRVYHHVTCAMDPKNISQSFSCCVSAILHENLNCAGFIA